MQVWHPQRGLLFEAPLATGSSRAPYLILPHPEIERALCTAAVATGRVTLRYQRRMLRLLRDADGRVRGAVVATEHGEEEVRARVVVNASEGIVLNLTRGDDSARIAREASRMFARYCAA